MNFNAFKLVNQWTDMSKSTIPYIKPTQLKPLFTPITINQPFPRATPESQGISSFQILSFLQDLSADRPLNMHSLLIIRNGAVITEASWPGQDSTLPKMTFSACKSITSLAIGFLIKEKRLSMDTRLVDIFDKRLGTLERMRIKDLTIRHLLTMTSGLTFNEAAAMTESDWLKSCLNSQYKNNSFSYNSLNSYMLSSIVTEITGERMSNYLKPRLFDPLGIHDYYWEPCPKGIDKGGWGLYIAPEDFGKIGWMVLNRGLWRGQRILPEAWLKEATSAHAIAPADYGDFNYGYHIWCARDNTSFLFNGMLGQNVLCMPDHKMILISNAGNDDHFQMSRYFEYVQKHFSKFPEVPAKDRKAQKALQKYIDSLHTIPVKSPRPGRKFMPKECRKYDGSVYRTENSPVVGLTPLILQVIQNNYTKGLCGIRFAVRGGTFIIDYVEADETYSIAIGWKDAAISNISVHGEPFRIAATGSWTHDEDGHQLLKVQIHYQETPFTRMLRFCWDGDELSIKHSELPGEGFINNSLSLFLTPMVEQPIIGAALEKVDTDYVNYKIDRMFSPVAKMSKENGSINRH